MSIVVVGSFMMDLVVRSKRAPGAGETVIGNSFSRFPGGKGANQAVAAARLGGQVTMVGRLGRDDFGQEMLSIMNREKINTGHVTFDEQHSTGIGSVVLDENGENRIIVVPGANLYYTGSDLQQAADVIRSARILIMQMEMDFGMTEQAVDMAHRFGVPVLFNPAPARKLPESMLQKLDYLTPNETEIEILTGRTVRTLQDAEAAALELLRQGVKNVVITLAAKGALLVDKSGTTHVPGFPVTPVDTVAAGDSFNGALAVQLAAGATLPEAARFANAVGALTVMREGAIPSLPSLREVNSFILQRSSAAL